MVDCCLLALVLASVLQTGVLSTPDVFFEPRVMAESTLIRFNKARYSTYIGYVHRMSKVWNFYSTEGTSGMVEDCSSYTVNGVRPREDWGRACRFETYTNLGESCIPQQLFGFEDGQPCIYLMLTKEVDWIPEPYTNETVPAEIRDFWSPDFITVKCEGESATDIDNMGMILYYPPHGFSFKYFPFQNQPGYQRPMVAVRFENANPAILLMITCRAYAKNLRSASVHFEVVVD